MTEDESLTAVAIFVKTPGLSPVKSRLAADIGEPLAIECHTRCAAAVAAVAVQAAVGPVYWALAEDDALALSTWNGLPTLTQRGKSLGERMQGIHDELVTRHGAGLLLGADLPQLDPEQLRLAARQLASGDSRGVIGPAADGGFWLVGANRKLPSATWLAPTYGAEQVMRQFLATETSSRPWFRLSQHVDLDTLADLPPILAELRALKSPHPIQVQLLDWLSGIEAGSSQSSSNAAS